MPSRGVARGRYDYRFRSVWRLPAPARTVYAVLERAEDYPEWWPQVKRTPAADGPPGTVRFRSRLPYDLLLRAAEARRDPDAGVLEIAMAGDLDGWARWTVLPTGGGCAALFEQEVTVRRPLLRLLSHPARPVLRANHALAMRAGERGLRAWLASGLEET